MKQVWSSPKTSFEQFVPQNYIAACGDQNKVYLFTCNAPRGTVYYYDDETKRTQHYVGGYKPCGSTHEAPVSSVFKLGFVDRNDNGKEDDGEEATIWLETNRWGRITNWQATPEVDINEWETAKS